MVKDGGLSDFLSVPFTCSNNATIVAGSGGGYHHQASSNSSFANTMSHDLKPANGGFASLRDEPITQRARVLYDYDASRTDELSLSADEVMIHASCPIMQYCFLLSASWNEYNFLFPATDPKYIVVIPIEHSQQCISYKIEDFFYIAIDHLPQSTGICPIYLCEHCHPGETSDNCTSCLG